jgi:PAS domain S-box-containing protein
MMADPEMRAVMDVLSTLWRSAYFTDGNLCQTIACRMVAVTQKHGTTESAVIGYALLAIFLGPIFHRYRAGEEFARLAVAIAEKHGFVAQKVGANFLMQMAVLWTQPIETALSCLDGAISSAQETGEVVYACYSLEHRLTDLIARGDHLDEIWQESAKALAFVERIRFRHVRDILCSVQAFVQSLRGPDAGAVELDEAATEARLQEGGIAVVICFHWILQVQRHFLLGDPAAALECAAKAKPLLWSARCHIQFVNYCVYHSLALGAVFDAASPERQEAILAELASNIQALERWAGSCAMTFSHKRLLLQGEQARLEGRHVEAMRLYESAARAAAENGFAPDEALANELAGRCCLAAGITHAAHAYLREARDGYRRWGAIGKVAQLDQRHPVSQPAASSVARATIEESAERLDVTTVLKMGQAISGEIVHESLIQSLMVIALEHAGAERGVLILQRGDEQRIEAEATIEAGIIVVRLPEQGLISTKLPDSILRHVVRRRESVILDDASAENVFSADPNIHQRHVRSVLCLPLLKQAKLIGVLYLENNLAPRVFTADRISLLKMLASQAAISLENTRLYRELERREAKIRRLVDSNIIGIFMWDSEGRILEANEAFLHMVGYDAEELVAGCLRWTDLTPPEWRERNAQTLEEVKTTGTAQPFEKEYLRKDGSRVPVLVGGAGFEEAGNRGVAFVLDLTERRRAEESLRELQSDLAHMNRLSIMGELSASLAHEITQPIGSARNNARAALNFLDRQPPDLDEVREALGSVVGNADRAGDIIDRIRDQIKKAPPRKLLFDLNEAIDEVLVLVRSAITKNGVVVQTRLASRLRPVHGDRVQLQQVIVNLILNALEAMDSVDVPTRELSISTVQNSANGIVVGVHDSGPGIDPEHLDRIFEAFYTTKSGGVGMGLSICRSIISAHGGRLWAESNEPRGTVFRFALPVGEDQLIDSIQAAHQNGGQHEYSA